MGDPGSALSLLRDRGGDVGIEHGVAGVAEAPLQDRRREPLTGWDEPRVVLRELHHPQTALGEVEGLSAEPPRIEAASAIVKRSASSRSAASA